MRLLTIISFFFLLNFQSQAQVITTIAGTGAAGFSGDGGAATAAQFDRIADIAVTPDGGYLLSDYSNKRIRKMDASGLIYTYAGNGSASMSGDGGPATAAGITNSGLSVNADGFGNVYLSQPGAIRKITPSGTISRIAGTGVIGYSSDGSSALAVPIGAINSITTDSVGDVYFSEYSFFRVRKISGGILTTVVGNGTSGNTGDGGPATAANVRPRGLCFDRSGNLYIGIFETGPSGYSYIRKVNTAGIISTIAGNGVAGYSGDGGPATAAAIAVVNSGLTVDRIGNVFFLDANNHLRKIDTSGIINTIAGTGVAGFLGDGCAPSDAQINTALSLDVDTSGNVYIADQLNYRIRRIWAGNAPVFMGGAAQYLSACQGVAAPVNTLLSVADADAVQPLNWAVLQAPAHGVLSAAYSGVSGGTVTPSGLSYTAAAAYTGPDTFSVVVTDCADAADTTMVYVTVADTPVAATLTGADTVCEGSTTTIVAGTTGGTWSSSNTARATVGAGGLVTGVSTGTVVLTYTITNACGNAVTTHSMVVKPAGTCIAGISGLNAAERPRIWPNPAVNGSVYISIPVSAEGATISITGTDGRLMHRTKYAAGTIASVHLPAGMYVVQVATATAVTNEVVVVQ